jgi:hypothetical protein
MNDQRTIEGRWWVFGPNRKPEFGTLRFDPEIGLTLDVRIAADINQTTVLDYGLHDVPDTVVGRDDHNRPVTLSHCRGPGAANSSGLRVITLHPLYALLGVEDREWGETQFTKVRSKMTLLHNWMGRSGIKATHGPELLRTYSHKMPDLISFSLSDGTKVTIGSELRTSHSSVGVEMHEGHTVSFDSGDRSLPRHDLVDYVRKFCNALTLFTGHPVYPETIYLESVGPPATTAELLYANKGITTAEKHELYHNMRVSFSEIADHIGDVMTRWYDIYSQIDSSLNLYFGTLFYPTLFSNHHFLFLAQALEVYHRGNPGFVGYVEESDKFRKRVRRICDAVPDEAEWLKERLGHANEKSLGQRLEELLARHQAYASQFIDDVKAFAGTVRATRNHYTHYSTKRNDLHKVAKDGELARVTYQLKTLLEICVFGDLGIEGKPIDRIISGFRRIQFAD